MKKVNKDYISVILKDYTGRFTTEKIRIKESEKLIEELATMANHDGFNQDDMLGHLHRSPLFTYMVLPFYEQLGSSVEQDCASKRILELLDSLLIQKTKVSFLDAALELIQECDYRRSVMKVEADPQGCVLRSFADYESEIVHFEVADDISILVSANNVGGDSDTQLSFTIFNGDVPVLPYRSLVEIFDCHEDLMESTGLFDADASQWDNFMRIIVSAANDILENKDDFFKKYVIEDGLVMAEKIKQMCLDLDSYYHWLTFERESVQIEYSLNEANPEYLETLNPAIREPYKMYSIGKKLTCGLYLAKNLNEWAQLGDDYCCLAEIYPQLIKFVPDVLQKVENACNEIKGITFDADSRSGSFDEMNRRMIERNLVSIEDDLRDWMSEDTNELQ